MFTFRSAKMQAKCFFIALFVGAARVNILQEIQTDANATRLEALVLEKSSAAVVSFLFFWMADFAQFSHF